LGNDKDVGENDGSIDEAFISLDGLKGERRSNLGTTTAFEEIMLSFRFVVFGQVATS
jgi:hypothetical protein